MKVLTSLRKRTRHGISVWSFCFDEETNQHFAVGGETLKVVPANDVKHLRQIYNNFKRYGFAEKLPVVKKQQIISDPWESQLPLNMQLQLDALAA